MKNYKYIGLFLLSLGFVSCDVDNTLPEIEAEVVANVALNKNGLDFSKYVAIGASFTAGYTDGAMFKAAQENSFPNILASKFGTDFKQPLMNDNIGGLAFNGTAVQPTRFYFNGAGPARLNAMPTTQLGVPATGGSFNNFGAPGAKSFHLGIAGYGQLNPYFGRMASSTTASVMGDALAQNPTFFTLSEIGGNDVLGYALSGGSGVDQTGNLNPATYGGSDITDPNVFAGVFSNMVTALTMTNGELNGTKGVVANVPYITDLANFTTVPYNPLDPTAKKKDSEELTDAAAALKAQIPLLNSVFGAVNQVYTGAGQPERAIVFSTTETNPVVIYDEDATDLSAVITNTLGASPTFVPFVQSLGLPAAAAPLVAGLLGQQYGKARSATSDDLILLASSTIIGKPNLAHAGGLIASSGGLLPATLAGQFSAEGVTLPLADQWVLTPQEQTAIKTATDAYNTTIATVANANPNVALVDFKGILTEASSGIAFDSYMMNTSLVTGGLVSLDGVHLTARGYALMANKILAAMDAEFGSNFTKATNGLAKADDYPTNYSVSFR